MDHFSVPESSLFQKALFNRLGLPEGCKIKSAVVSQGQPLGNRLTSGSLNASSQQELDNVL